MPRDDIEDVVDLSFKISDLILKELDGVPLNICCASITMSILNVFNCIKGEVNLDKIVSKFTYSMHELLNDSIKEKKNESDKH